MDRQKIIDALSAQLKTISIANGYATDFDAVEYWLSIPAQYDRNYLIYSDLDEKYSKKGGNYIAAMLVEITAIVIETDVEAAVRGNIALGDIQSCLSRLKLCNAFVNLVESDKFVETKGKTACQVILTIRIEYEL